MTWERKTINVGLLYYFENYSPKEQKGAMTNSEYLFLQNLWNRLGKDTFSPKNLIERVRIDGGLDVSGLSDDDMSQLLEGNFAGDWHEVAFSFSELLAYYAAIYESNHIKDLRQIVGWGFSVFMIRDAIEKNVTDLDLQLNSFIESFFYIREKLEIEESILIILSFFRSPMTSEWENDFQIRLNEREETCLLENSNRKNRKKHEFVKRFKIWVGLRFVLWGIKLIRG